MMWDQNAEVGLPRGWVECSIREVTLPVSIIDPKEELGREIVYIDIASIDNTRQAIVKVKKFRLQNAPLRARQIVQSDDVLFATVRPYLRNIALVSKDYDQQIASTAFSVLRPSKGVCPAFLFLKAFSKGFVDALSRVQYGVSYPAVRDEQVRDQLLLLPPSREQLRIVAKIEELFSELDKGVESLKTAQAKLNVYRQAVLKHAFEGKLTAQWREENEDKLETPDRLLTRIKEEREALYEQQIKAWESTVKTWEEAGKLGKKPTKPKTANDPSPIGRNYRERLLGLPDEWIWVRLGKLLYISPRNGIYKPTRDYGSGTQIIRIDDFYDGHLTRGSGFKRLRLSDKEVETYRVENSDLIINRVNSIEYLGKCALVENLTENTVFESNIMRCCVIEDVISKPYVAAYLASREGRNRLCENAKHAVNQASINQKDVGDTLVPITTIEEQTLIVHEIELKLSHTDELISQIEDHLEKVEALRQSILKKALAGQLVGQDLHDEPASVLLGRIRAERERAIQNTKKTTKRRTTA